ncbi:Sugar lactone lactonase YvrE [Micromonospora pattaloongensis]|uniref:Sugar lactone lactonase YvrE n=1 Tax=Micromonospora pattaloongensis TaxID=405436 RepID=A0A1H3FJT3_9ACTN|nr:SMP-30/gluconolactonase/LRE family protein [Micromonospora pattaloongensis]SDX91256.1 Sugar lactone lactonase YvrE [Micromonospora pattaloongensis]
MDSRSAPRWIRAAKAPATVPPPLDGDWAPLDLRLDSVERFTLPSGVGPEDVLVDDEGRLVTGGDDGRLWRWAAGARPGDEPEQLAETGGRPLGIELDPTDGSLVVCDAERGLLRVRADGAVTKLADAAGGAPLRFCNNAAVAADGAVFFTDSSDRYGVHTWKRDLLEHRPNGRLLRYDPGSGAVDVLATGLYFPNGVALTPDGSALVVAETSTHRLLRVTLDGAVTELVDLPAYPDNLSAVGDGTYWVALPSPRLPIEERLLPYPFIRQLAALLPDALQPQPRRYGLVALVDGAGRVLRTLHGPSGSYRFVTGVRQDGDRLWLGSLTEPAVARVSV